MLGTSGHFLAQKVNACKFYIFVIKYDYYYVISSKGVKNGK